jgi:hypothetical protein
MNDLRAKAPPENNRSWRRASQSRDGRMALNLNLALCAILFFCEAGAYEQGSRREPREWTVCGGTIRAKRDLKDVTDETADQK